MGLDDQACDSCDAKTDVLFPVAILDEQPFGTVMVKRWYCCVCMKALAQECEEAENNDDTDNEAKELPKPDNNVFTVSCKGCGFNSKLKDFKIKLAAAMGAIMFQIECPRCGAKEVIVERPDV